MAAWLEKFPSVMSTREPTDPTDKRYERFEAKVRAIVGPCPYTYWYTATHQLRLDGTFTLDELRLLIAACEEVYGCGHEEGGCDCPH